MLRFFISVDFYNKNLNSDIGSSRPIHFHAYKLTNKQINKFPFFGYKTISASYNNAEICIQGCIFQLLHVRAETVHFFGKSNYYVCAAYTNSCYTIFAQFTIIEISNS